MEKAGLLQESAEGTLNIEEHSFAEDEDLDQIKFSDEKFKNRMVKIKDITDLLHGGAEEISDINESSSGKSEPKMGDGTNVA